MSTTVLIVEHVLAGVQFSCAILVVWFALHGWPEPLIRLPENLLVPLAILSLAFVYPMGIVIDELSDSLLSRRERKIRASVFESLGVGSDVKLFALLAHQESSFLIAYFDYLRMRIRITRSTFLNTTLLLVALLFALTRRWSELASLDRQLGVYACVLCVVFCLSSFAVWSSLVRTFAQRIGQAAQPPKSEQA